MDTIIRKLFFTTALSLSLISSGIASAADKEGAAATDTRSHYQHEENISHGKILAALPKDKAELFRTTMKQVHDKNKELSKQIKVLNSDLSTITKAANFDKKAYIAKSTEIANLKNTMMTNKIEALADFITKLTPEERNKFADSMNKTRNGHKGRHHNALDNKDKTATDVGKKY